MRSVREVISVGDFLKLQYTYSTFHHQGQTDGPKADPMTIPTLPAEMEECYLNDDASDDEELPYPAAASDVMNPVEVKSIWDSMDQTTTPLQSLQMWPSKSTRKSRVKNEPR